MLMADDKCIPCAWFVRAAARADRLACAIRH